MRPHLDLPLCEDMQEHGENVLLVEDSVEAHYRANFTIPFLGYLLKEFATRFSLKRTCFALNAFTL